MKKLIPAIIAALLLLCVCFAFFLQNKRKGETVLSIKDAESSYTFKASFYSVVTPEVTRYMDSCTAILRKENASFRIKISDGDLTIMADKQDNSVIVISHIRKMCQSISDILIQN
ncbi:MAG: hypothetical protein JWR38_5223 [Mucilaginibacter sp.]|nr:hypothetical protein [Mucilaginibacter sp.]